MMEIIKECKDFFKQKISNEYKILTNGQIIDYKGNKSQNIELLV